MSGAPAELVAAILAVAFGPAEAVGRYDVRRETILARLRRDAAEREHAEGQGTP